MKKLPALLSTPARVVIALSLIVLVAEFLIMVLIEAQDTYLKDSLPGAAWILIDSIVLTAIVSTALYILIFRPMREQRADLERQLDELRRFQKLTVGRELRMKELAEDIAALRNPLSAEPAGDVPVTGDSLEAPSNAAAPTTRTTEENQRSALLFMLEDLEAARKKIEQAHQEWMAALDVVDDPIFLHDQQFRILRCNKAYQQRAGISFEQIIGQPYYEIFPKTGAPLPCCLRAMEKAEEEEEEEEVTVGEAIYRSRSFSIHDEQGAHLYSVHILEDITESKGMETQLKNSEERHRQIIQTSMDGFWVADTGGRILEVNDAYCQLSGYTREELLNMRIADVEAKEAPEETAQHIREIMTNGHASFETRHRRKDGQLLDIEVSTVHRPDTEDGHLFVFLHDITERKQAEIAIQHANRALATLSAVNKSLVRATGEDELLQSICQAIVEQRGYRLAWVGYVQHDESKSIKIMARAGHDEGYLDAMQLTWAETERGMGPNGRAIRSGATQLCQDIANDPQYLPWRDEALKRGLASNIALPLGDGEVFGILHVYAGEVNAFIPAEIDLLEEMARDLAFGVRSLHVRHERDLAQDKVQQQLAQLQDSLEDTMRAIAGIVEMRDPYTAGHQIRVADLAAAIAKQIGLPDEQAHVIHLAGTVHDLGKINVPAEILSKPGKITDLEFGLIKVHPQAGYDILKGIDFPWPIAQMVLQHHERMDGSGYPQGLKGDATLLEARILAVADVVEAISAHRPYRAGLGIETALAEITKNRGIYYDSQVVDACLALFREQHYSFKS